MLDPQSCYALAEVTWSELPSSYDRVAAIYERTFLDELDHKVRDRELLDAFTARTMGLVLDVGCGPGQVGAYVRGSERTTVGVDSSAQMARLAATRLDGAVVGDMRRLPFRSGSIGGILAFYSIIHVPRDELGTVLGEFRRVLRDGGQLLLSAHEGSGQMDHSSFLGESVPFVATLFHLDELVSALHGVGMDVTLFEQRFPYDVEGATTRLYVAAEKPS